MTPRWWRIGVVYEEDGDPWTWTFHVRAVTERTARRLVAERVSREHDVFLCHPSDPLLNVSPKEHIAANYGPYRRSWNDPMLKDLLRENERADR